MTNYEFETDITLSESCPHSVGRNGYCLYCGISLHSIDTKPIKTDTKDAKQLILDALYGRYSVELADYLSGLLKIG